MEDRSQVIKSAAVF